MFVISRLNFGLNSKYPSVNANWTLDCTHIHFPAAAFSLLIHYRGKRCTIRFHTSGFTCYKIHIESYRPLQQWCCSNDAAAMMIICNTFFSLSKFVLLTHMSNVWKRKIQFFCATGNLCHYVEWGMLHAILKNKTCINWTRICLNDKERPKIIICQFEQFATNDERHVKKERLG